MKILFGSFLMVAACLLTSVDGQESEEPYTVSLPDSVMKQVVERIVIEHFKSRGPNGVFYFSEQNIDREWLPKVRKIEFVFVEEVDGREVHFFKEPKQVGAIYQIDFGWGDPDCSAEGETWEFKVANGAAREIAQTNGGWGSGCSSVTGSRPYYRSTALAPS